MHSAPFDIDAARHDDVGVSSFNCSSITREQAVEFEALHSLQREAVIATKLEGDCDEVRRKSRQQFSLLEAVVHQKKKVEKEVHSLTQKLQSLSVEVETLTRQWPVVEPLAIPEKAEKALSYQQVAVLERETENEERLLKQLRRKHAELYSRLRDADREAQQLSTTVREMEKRKSHLMSQSLHLAAMESNESYHEAVTVHSLHGEMVAKTKQQRDSIQSLRMEKQSMLGHLAEGAGQRTAAINRLRRVALKSVLQRKGDKTVELLEQLLCENSALRSQVVQLSLQTAQEREALQQLHGVLCERMVDAIGTKRRNTP